MKISFNSNISKQVFYERGLVLRHIVGDQLLSQNTLYELGRIETPRLTFDKELWTALPNGKLIYSLFDNPPVPIEFNFDSGPYVTYSKKINTWPPTIDTSTHLCGQRNSTKIIPAEKILEVFCGIGMAGIYAAINGSNVQHIRFADLEPNYVIDTTFNANVHKIPYVEFVQSDVFSAIRDKYDLIIASAVPAISVVPNIEREIIPYLEGTGALEMIIRDAPNYLNKGGALIISHSSAGNMEFQESISKNGANVNQLYERNVLFRGKVLDNSRWVDYLKERKGVFQMINGNLGHTLTVDEITY